MVEYYALMYEYGKMRPVQTIPGNDGGGIKENDGGVNSTMTYCKNFGKYHNSTTIQKDKKSCISCFINITFVALCSHCKIVF
jgi:hypothetical protein